MLCMNRSCSAAAKIPSPKDPLRKKRKPRDEDMTSLIPLRKMTRFHRTRGPWVMASLLFVCCCVTIYLNLCEQEGKLLPPYCLGLKDSTRREVLGHSDGVWQYGLEARDSPARHQEADQLLDVQADPPAYPWKPRMVMHVDCRKLFVGDPAEMERARRFEQEDTTLAVMSDTQVASIAASCPLLKKTFPFITSYLTEEERDFPIAFSLLVFKDAEQVLRLLYTIFRPQNYYCVHVDVKSDEEFHRAMSAVVACFPNVFLSSRSVDVEWATFSVLEPEIICMQDLWRHKKWKYFINLTGQEFPLKTNYELVQILTAYRGANNLEGTRQRADERRWKKRGPPPGGIIPHKGSVHIVVNRDFVDFVLHTDLSRQFQNWARHVSVPDEVFFTSLNHNPHLGIRGSYKGEPETHPTTYPFLTRFKNWGVFPFDYPCASGNRVRMVCILCSGDLPLLDSRPELFANKFYSRTSQVALDCLAERLFNRTRDQVFCHANFNVSHYANMPFVKNMVATSAFVRNV